MSPNPPYPVLSGLNGLTARTLYCIGRNYAEHAKELGNAVPTEPVVFLKPLSSLSRPEQGIVLPPQSARVDPEVELVVAIGKQASWISEEEASACIAGVAVGIDVTARDLQDKAKQKALPWAVAKGFDTFAVVGDFVPPKVSFSELALELSVNGTLRQRGAVSEMLFSVPRLISFLSTIFTLSPGDLIFTGTPPGVAPIQGGDRIVAALRRAGHVEALSQFAVSVRTRDASARLEGAERHE